MDDIGVGGGVVDRLQELRPTARIQGVNVGEAPEDRDRFFNRRAELWWSLREWVRDVGQLPNDPRLLSDITAPKYRYTSRGQIQLEAKAETKKRLGRSPDDGDALMLTFSARTSSGVAYVVSGEKFWIEV